MPFNVSGKNAWIQPTEQNLQLRVLKDYESAPLNQDAFFKPKKEKGDCILVSDLASCTWVMISYFSPKPQRTELAVG